jgi:hypothetical protein
VEHKELRPLQFSQVALSLLVQAAVQLHKEARCNCELLDGVKEALLLTQELLQTHRARQYRIISKIPIFST